MLISIIGLSAPATVLSGTLVEILDEQGHISKISYQGDMARMETPGEPGYALMNTKKRKMYIVNLEERTVMEMGDLKNMSFPGVVPGGGSKPSVKFTKKGGGPKILGYETIHYHVSANGQACQDEYLAPALIKDKQLSQIFDTMSKMSSDMDPSAMIAAGGDICDLVDLQGVKTYMKSGFPLRTVKNGKTTNEVTKIKRNEKFPADIFELPKGYKIVNMQQMMQQMQQQMMQHMKQ